jgi:hypothetical protein
LNLRSPVRGQLISSESHSAALARLLGFPEGTGLRQATMRAAQWPARSLAIEFSLGFRNRRGAQRTQAGHMLSK